jgi:phosphoribosyl 1,2-cyclic phosphodiesterase
LRIRFWGVRGTIPTPGPDTVKLGGNTSCIDILTSDKQLIIIDAGSGILRLGKTLQKEYPDRIKANILISHTHWDHIQGFPFFSPVWGRHNRFIVVGQKRVGKQLEEILANQFVEPYLPFQYQTLPADLIVKEVEDGETIIIGDDTAVTFANLNHPGGCLGFRVENNGSIVTYCSDVGHPDGGFDPNVLQLASGADLLIHDAHFTTMEEKAQKSDWGHSCWIEAVQIAVEAGVGCLALFHYSPDSEDTEMEDILLKAREIFPRTILAREGMTVHLPMDGHLPG